MFAMRMDAMASSPPIDRSRAAITARSRRSAREHEQAHWTAQDERKQAERQRSPSGAASRPALSLLRRA